MRFYKLCSRWHLSSGITGKPRVLGIAVLCLALIMPGFALADENVKTEATAVQFEEELPNVTETITKYSTADYLNIREEPNTDCEILDQAYVNTSFTVVLEINGWSMVETSNGYAYIKSEYLSETEVPQYKNLGRFKISHYCCEKYKHICGTGSGKTATGLDIRPGLISVDPSIIPLGSTILINGAEYVAEDTGGMIKGRKIDIAVSTHQEALELGVYYVDIYMKEVSEAICIDE